MASQPHTFPDDASWGSKSGLLRKVLVPLAATSPGSWLIRTLSPVDKMVMQKSHGRFTLLGPVGASTVLVTTIGRKSGQRRTVPLLYRRQDGHIYLVGSNFGQEHHPAWALNLGSNPQCWVEIGGVKTEATATLLEGAEKDDAYEKFADEVAAYRAYRKRTDRDIRVFRLTAV
ncbi:nitroreductase family deazaflavin-dependent oxidoreductase [Gordonia sp. CPCC 205515]|uniref:nitroreductase family deazaflavin-dependent oxidoreductase n=1 Tax=Gordonia sp. CPCC 205515 TaxID=3140791 RepID=UPI003AF38FAD